MPELWSLTIDHSTEINLIGMTTVFKTMFEEICTVILLCTMTRAYTLYQCFLSNDLISIENIALFFKFAEFNH